MSFIKMLIGLPLIIVVLIFAFVNNDLVSFNLWPFYLEITVSQSVAIVFLLFLGFIWGKFDSWLSYSPVRRALRQQKKANKKLNKEQEKLTEKVSDLEGSITSLKEEAKDAKAAAKDAEIAAKEAEKAKAKAERRPLSERLKNLFKRK